MISRLIFLALFCICNCSFSTAQIAKWGVSTQGAFDVEVQKIAIDDSANIYVGGYVSDSADLDPGPASIYYPQQGLADMFLQKFKDDGTLAWAIQVGGPAAVIVVIDIAISQNQEVYICGRFEGSIDFDPSPSFLYGHATGPGINLYTVKYDQFGNIMWIKTMGGTADHEVKAISLDKEGNVILCGMFEGTSDFDPHFVNTHNLTSNGGEDGFIAKLDPSGNLIWAGQIGGISNDQISAVAIDDSSNIYMTGYAANSLDVDPGPGVWSENLNGYKAALTGKIDSAGDLQWVNVMKGASYIWPKATAIELDSAGNLYCLGAARGAIDVDPGPVADSMMLDGLYLQKLDITGTVKWTASIEQSPAGVSGNPMILELDESGNVIIAGHYSNYIRFHEVQGGTSEFTSAVQYSPFAFQVTPVGSVLWETDFDGIDMDYIRGFQFKNGNHMYFAGTYSGTLSFPPTWGLSDFPTGAGFSSFLIKFFPSPSPGPGAIEENILGLSNIYPNPTTGHITIDFDKMHSNLVLEIIDVSGKLIQSSTHRNSQRITTTLEAPAGLYFVRVQSEVGEQVFKLVKD